MPPSRRKQIERALRTGSQLLVDAFRGYVNRSRRSDTGLTTDPDVRRAQLARMGTSVGARIGTAKLRTIGKSEHEQRRAQHDAAMRSAADVLQVMGNMKGAVMKIAQMASFAFDGLPSGVQEQLRQLQSAAPPMSYELAAEVVTSELGRPPAEAFASFDTEPLAAASIGQVHAATTHDGRDVVVKVQYPGVDEAIKADLQNADLLFQTVAGMFGGIDPRALLEEVVARMTEEFDYRLEAKNQQHFADRYRDHAYVKVPDVIDELSAERVITSERVQGRKFYDVLDDPTEAKNTYGEIIYRFAHESTVVDGVFSGDPHPGNYLFMDDGRVCFLDFGLVKRLTSDELSLIQAPSKGVLTGDRTELERSLRALGVIEPGTEVDPERLWGLFQVFLKSIVEDETFIYTRKAVGDAFREIGMPNSPYGDVLNKLNFPAALMLWQRYTFGTAAVLGHLEAEGNWHRIAREHVLGDPPSTQIGKSW
jgi:predicted unusual protein kinase regulating ubiquinone biosynthesis (AarF/ABC1/UbiB family)